ncbi:MAG: hypothetical protein TREMPRED_002722 [Tremellales sp. Tagirdzhanova-0007]|nr:MAG: hypothetical protein TREMPRED_002722 [Tremellales sp. Tagirdzhanova-0007]
MRLSSGITFPILFLSLPILADRVTNDIVQDANRLLSEGSYVEAARAYGEAIVLEPDAYVNYYKRATAYLSLGRQSAALDDFDSILRLNPSFAQAHFQKSKILAKEGEFDKARSELKSFGKSKSDPEAIELTDAITVASAASTSAHKAAKSKNWVGCVEQSTKALEVAPNSAGLRELRVECCTEMGDVEAVYGDISSWRPALKLLDGEDGLLARFDLSLDEASVAQDGLIYLSPQFSPRTKSRSRLELFALACKAAVNANELGKHKGMRWCEETLIMDENNIDALVGRGERLLKEEKWEEAVRVLERAFENGGRSSQDAAEGAETVEDLEAEGLLQAKTAHPDVGGSEAKMAALNEAYEVLSDPGEFLTGTSPAYKAELRTRYDNGEDPNDPQQGQQQNPFAHHGGGMPFQFFQQGFPGGTHGQKVQFQWG